ncbi:MAG: DegT/DnrJ/EryC1/StrS family aminotransferase [Acidobacteria bacterium]|nr:DegT/DnrJ/EryC1/StrS family aminotransferase [Acidobacteriota bacterium]
MRSGNLREGPFCRRFEEEFAAEVGARYAVSVSSGTAALHVAFTALLDPGDEVLVPTFTFVATASMVQVAGAKPVFCDVDPHTFTIDVAAARSRITAKTKAIAPVHLFGNPCNVDALKDVAQEFGLKVVWDAAQAHGTRYQGKDIGSFPDAVCYSFYPSKNMTTGEGGMITMNDRALYEKCRLMRSHGQSDKYYHTLLGFNYRLTDVMAALGLEQLRKLAGRIARRRENANQLRTHLEGIPGIQTPREQKGGESSFNLYSILIDSDVVGCTRDEFMRLLVSENIGCAVNYPRCLHQQPVFADIARGLHFPAAEDVAGRILSIPVEPSLSRSDIDLVAAGVRKVANAVKPGRAAEV